MKFWAWCGLFSTPLVRILSGEKRLCGVFIFCKCLKANGAPIRSCFRLGEVVGESKLFSVGGAAKLCADASF